MLACPRYAQASSRLRATLNCMSIECHARPLDCEDTIDFAAMLKIWEDAMRHHRIFGASILDLLGAGQLVGGSATAQAACGLQSADNRIKHVVHIQFDNVHLRRDKSN